MSESNGSQAMMVIIATFYLRRELNKSIIFRSIEVILHMYYSSACSIYGSADGVSAAQEPAVQILWRGHGWEANREATPFFLRFRFSWHLVFHFTLKITTLKFELQKVCLLSYLKQEESHLI